MRLVLASASPRRRELLGQIGIAPDEVRPSKVDEDPRPGELPRQYCRRMANEKAMQARSASDELVLAADTTVALGRRIIGKPADEAEAAEFLFMLSGRRHRVISAVAVRHGSALLERVVMSTVKMKRLSDTEVSAYLRSGEWEGKAGAYGIQGMAGAFIPWLKGSFTAVVGLPLAETAGLLRAMHFKLPHEQ